MIDEVFLGHDIPSNNGTNEEVISLLVPIVGEAVQSKVPAQRQLLESEGFGEGIRVAVCLTITLDLTSIHPRLLHFILNQSRDSLLDLIREAEQLIYSPDKVEIIAIRLWFDRLVFVPELEASSHSMLITSSDYTRSADRSSRTSQGKLYFITATVINKSAIKMRTLARYFRCINERCRSEFPVEETFCEPNARSARGGSLKCIKCRHELVEISLLGLSEHYFEMQLYVPSWNKCISAHCPSDNVSIVKVGSKYCFAGYYQVDFKRLTYYLDISHLNRIDQSDVGGVLVQLSEYNFENFMQTFSPVHNLRLLQTILIFIPSAKIVILTEGDPLHYRIINGISQDTSLNIKLIEPARMKNAQLQKECAEVDIVLDWRSNDDELISHLMLFEEKSIFLQINTYKPPLNGDGPLRWIGKTTDHLQEYFIKYRETICMLNDEAQFPLHHPTRQFELLMEAVERMTLFRGSDCVCEFDLIFSAAMGEILLEARYKHCAVSGKVPNLLNTPTYNLLLSPPTSSVSPTSSLLKEHQQDISSRITRLRHLMKL